jgi:hypothetical protein
MPARHTLKAKKHAAKKKAATRRASTLMNVLRTVENRAGKIGKNVGRVAGSTGNVAMNIVKNAENSIWALLKSVRRAL